MKKIFAAILALVLVLTACGNNGGKQPVASEDYYYIYVTEISTMNYLVSNQSVVNEALANFVEGLVENDIYGRYVPAMAESWEVSEDGLTWTLHIRKGVEWQKDDGSNYGEKVTAHDWVTSAEYILNPDNASKLPSILFAFINNAYEYYNGEVSWDEVGVKAIDDYTLEYTLSQPAPYFVSVLTYSAFMPVNEKFLNEMGDEFGLEKDKILYSGGYLFETWDRDVQRVYVKNDKYWDAGNVNIERIQLNKVEDSTVALEMFLRGEITAVGITTTQLDAVWGDERLFQTSLGYSTWWFSINYASEINPNFSEAAADLNFRKALYHGFNRATLLQLSNPHNPRDLERNTINPPSLAFTDSGTDYTDLSPLKEIKESDPYDVSLAQQYMAAARETLGDSVEWPVVINYPVSADTLGEQEGSLIKQMLEENLGTDNIVVNLITYVSAQFYEMVDSREWDLTMIGWGPDYADPSTFLDTLYLEGEMNYGMITDEELFRLLDVAANISDMDERLAAYAVAEAYLIENALVIPVRGNGGNYAMNYTVPYTAPTAPAGIASAKFKFRVISDEPITTEMRAELKAQYEEAKANLAK